MSSKREPTQLFPAFDTCPGCKHVGLTLASTEGGQVFRCEGCGRGWQVGMGFVSEVDPDTGQHLVHMRHGGS